MKLFLKERKNERKKNEVCVISTFKHLQVKKERKKERKVTKRYCGCKYNLHIFIDK